MNEWEIIGRFVDLDNRLRTLEGRPTVQEKPQPVATGLCEDIEILLKHFDDYFSGVALESFKSRVRHALTAERKRAVLVDEVEVTRNKVIEDYRIVLKLQKHAGNCACALCTRLLEYDAALDAFDKGAENG